MESIKQMLLSRHQAQQIEAIYIINNHLKNSSKSERTVDIHFLINSDIANILCHCLSETDSDILRLILSSLEIISESELFYTRNVATQAIIKILQNGFLIAQNSKEKRTVLYVMTRTLKKIIDGAYKFQINLKLISNIAHLLEFINSLRVIESKNPAHVTIALDLYSRVLCSLEDIENENILLFIVQLHRDILTAASVLVRTYTAEENNPKLLGILKQIVVICDAGINLCKSDDESLSNTSNECEDQRANNLKLLVDIICQTMLQIIIPNAKVIKISLQVGITFYYIKEDASADKKVNMKVMKYFLRCLFQLYKRRDIKVNEFSTQLLAQGYLKYFYYLLLDTDFVSNHETFHELIGDCISRILTDLFENTFTMAEWSDGPHGFRRFIKAGILSYKDSHSLDINSPTMDALLFLFYFHYLGTRDPDIMAMVETTPLIKKIKNLSIDDLPEIPTIQVILFFFAYMVNENQSKVTDKNFPYAMLNIVEIMMKVGVENCYTHHPALPSFIIQNSVVPCEIRNRVIKLWLEFEDSIHLLVSPERMPALVDSLLNIIKTAEVNLLERASNELLRIINNNNDYTPFNKQQIIQVMWESLPQILMNFTSDYANGIGKYLEILHQMSIDKVSILLAIHCSNYLIAILEQDNLIISSDVKTLVVKYISKMLEVGLEAKDRLVASMYTNNYKILDKLRVQAFSKEHDNLSAASWKCLNNILSSQKELSINCTKPLSLSPMDLFNALLRKAHVCFEVMKFLDKIWIGNIEYPAILRPIYTKKEAQEILTGIYFLYIRNHLNAPPNLWGLSFQYLSNLLEFLKQNYNFILNQCCNYICNHSVVTLAITSDYFGETFFKFVNIWLNCGLLSQSSYIKGALEKKSRRDKGQEERIFNETTFDIMIQRLNKHMTEPTAGKNPETNDVKELKSTLAKFL